jgi:hypothetical protein
MRKIDQNPLMPRSNIKAVSRFLFLVSILSHSPLLLPHAHAQAPDTLWTRTFGGEDWDFGSSLAQIDSTHFLIAGYSHSFGNGYELYLIKIDAHGDTMWTRTYGGVNDDEAFETQQTAAGDFVIAGWTSSYGSGLRDAYLLLTDANGDTSWTRTYGGPARDIAYGVCATMDGGFVLVGETRSSGSGLSDLFLVKADSQGDSLWANAYGGSEQEMGYSVIETADSGFIAVGFTESSGSGMGDIYILKTNASGDSIWAKTFGGPYDERAMRIEHATDSGFVITGYSSSFGAGGTDVYTLHISNNGDSIWALAHGGSQNECGYDIQAAPGGGYLIAGKTLSFGSGDEDVYLLHLNDDGDTIWTQTFGGPSGDGAVCLIIMPDHGLLVTGETYSYGSGGYDAWLIRTEPVTGISASHDRDQSSDAGIHLQAYPNPFTTSVELQIDCESEKRSIGEPEIIIFDVMGKRVGHFSLFPSSFILPAKLVWDGRDEAGKEVPPGVYFAACRTGYGADTRKILKLK